MDHVKIIYAYLDKTRNSFIWLFTEEPDYLVFPNHKFDREYSKYGYVI